MANEHKHAQTTNNNCDFASQLLSTVSQLHDNSLFSDINIKLRQTSVPAHKLVLNARSKTTWQKSIQNVDELDWTHLEEDVGKVLLKWLYTDDIATHVNNATALGLLQAAHEFDLMELFNLCEDILISNVNVETCIQFYCISANVNGNKLKEFCFEFMKTHWNEFKSEDFNDMPAHLLLTILKCQSKYPLHTAVQFQREDVIRLCLAEKTEASNVNSLGENGYLPLQIALIGRNIDIAETLINLGNADVNAFDGNGSTLLIDAISRSDEFTAKFLLNRKCDINLTERNHGNTALHCICDYNQRTCDDNTFTKMCEVADELLEMHPNVNVQNKQGDSPLYKAIASVNSYMIDRLLTIPDIIIDVQTPLTDCALELLFSQEHVEFDWATYAKKLIDMGAKVDILKAETQNSLLQQLALKKLEHFGIFLVDYCTIDILNNINNIGYTVLHIAAEQNLAKLVRKLLMSGASPCIQSDVSKLNTPVHLAVISNSMEALNEFVNYSLSSSTDNAFKYNQFNCKNIDGDSPLILSIALKRSNLVPILINGGSDVDVRDADNRTLLHKAIINDDPSTAFYLLENGADMNALTNENETPLLLAIRQRLPQIVDILCKNGANISLTDSKSDSPLWTAVKLGYEDICKILIQNGADIDSWTDSGDGGLQTLLHRAIDEKNETAAILLIRSGCDLDSPKRFDENRTDVQSYPPLHMCAELGLVNTLQALIDYGANINNVDNNGNTALHIAMKNGREDIISKILCHPNVNLKTINKNGHSVFTAALEMKNHNAAQRILDRLPNAAEQMDKRGRNYLHKAIIENDLESILFLLSIQIDVNSRVHDANQSTPLHLAANSSNELIIRNLILAGARINERDAYFKTPLHIAAEKGNQNAISIFIENNADVDAADADGNNALHIAVHFGQLNAARELLVSSSILADAVNLKGRNPLHELCRTCEDNIGVSICELFFECMPTYPLNVQDMEGNTPLLLAYMRGKASVCKILVKNGACLGTENHNGINIFSFKLATSQLLYKLLNQLPQESPWSESDLCQECYVKFTLTLRKHHCRHCGRVLCFKCSSNDMPILKFGLNKPVRVCSTCFYVLQENSDI